MYRNSLAFKAYVRPVSRFVCGRTPRVELVNQQSIISKRYYSEEAKKAEEKKETEAEAETETAESAKDDEGLSPEAAEYKAKYLAKDKECAQLKDKYVRSIADFRNLQETTKREVQKAKDYALQKFSKDLLESVDNLDRALLAVDEAKLRENADENKEFVQFYDGVKLTQDVFEKTLARYGLVKLHPLGEKFDPNMHEATFEVPQADKEPGTIFHVQQTGFALNDRVIRAPKVGVVKGAE